MFHTLISLLKHFFKTYNWFQTLLNFHLFHLNFHSYILIEFSKVAKRVNILLHRLYLIKPLLNLDSTIIMDKHFKLVIPQHVHLNLNQMVMQLIFILNLH